MNSKIKTVYTPGKRRVQKDGHSASNSSALSECGAAQGPLPSESRAEIDLAYSQYLQAKMLEKLMGKNGKDIESSIETQLSMLNEQYQQKLANITILKQRLLEIKSLNEEEKNLDELIPQLEILEGKMSGVIPVVDIISESMTAGMDKVHAKNIKLPASKQEKELLAASLDKMAQESAARVQASPETVSQLSELAARLQVTSDKSKLTAENCCRNLLPECAKQLALCISQQGSLLHGENKNQEAATSTKC